MSIVVLANSDIGLYKFRKELLHTLIEQGYTVYICVPDGENIEKLQQLGCKFIDTKLDRRGINPIKDLALIINYYNLIKRIKPNQVLTYTIKPNIYGGIICRLLNIQYSTNITGLGTAFQNEGLLKKCAVFLYKIALKRAKNIFFENSANMHKFIHEKIAKKEQACLLSGAGVNLNEYKFVEYPCHSNILRFLFVGRIMKEKGIEELLYAAKKIKEEYPNSEFNLVGFCEEKFEETLHKSSRENIVNFVGYKDDVKPFIEQCHCFVLPSYHEGMANTLLECGATGRPLITSNIPGCKETVIDGETGFLCNVADGDDLYYKIKKFIELPYEKKQAMGIASHNHIAKHFNKEDVIKKTIGCL